MNPQAADNLQTFFASLRSPTPAEWEILPDIGLYMDQVVTWLERQMSPPEISARADFQTTEKSSAATNGSRVARGAVSTSLTPSMINNYAKAKIIPRTEGKKYSREHLALLLVVFSLKRVLSMSDLGALTSGLMDSSEIKRMYEIFLASISASTADTAEEVRASLDPYGESPAARNAIRDLALKLSIEASAKSLAAEKLLALLAGDETEGRSPEKKKDNQTKDAPKKAKRKT